MKNKGLMLLMFGVVGFSFGQYIGNVFMKKLLRSIFDILSKQWTPEQFDLFLENSTFYRHMGEIVFEVLFWLVGISIGIIIMNFSKKDN